MELHVSLDKICFLTGGVLLLRGRGLAGSWIGLPFTRVFHGQGCPAMGQPLGVFLPLGGSSVLLVFMDTVCFFSPRVWILSDPGSVLKLSLQLGWRLLLVLGDDCVQILDSVAMGHDPVTSSLRSFSSVVLSGSALILFPASASWECLFRGVIRAINRLLFSDGRWRQCSNQLLSVLPWC